MTDDQDAASKLVQDHVFTNITLLVVDFVVCHDGALEDFEGQTDYEQAVKDYIEASTDDELKEILVSQWGIHNPSITDDLSREYITNELLDGAKIDGYENFCVDYGIEAFPIDIWEYWTVSDFLAGHLIKHGEKVVTYGQAYIWGRTCCGQAIKLDPVMTDIVKTIPAYYK